MSLERAAEVGARLVAALDGCVVGSQAAAEALVAAYMAGGHVLVEGPPGLGKTLLARAFASALGLGLARVQFTPDLMPTDVTGGNVFDQQSGAFRLWRGPVFSPVLMGDEINRTPPKTQSALLEAMQELQVTIDGVTYGLDPSFFVIATQNPIEFEGTYPLPEAQLDRFLVRVTLGLPAAEAEVEVYRRAVRGSLAGWNREVELPSPLVTAGEAAALRQASRLAHVAEELLGYLQALAAQVRSSPHVELGPSPRGGLALLELGRAGAVLEGRGHVIPDDLRRFVGPCWGHRVIVKPESELEGLGVSHILEQAAAAVPVPR
ncbi:MAG TPA: MoxR family ATPase [Thermoanaerobaculaceae bacterium]|nr:MoxR family ATPase [Thermoanaerobaculaceae bacterium]HRS15151.1 MoxR family ATPase [Thermoanaerobaculaceae bacterium]